MTPGGADWTYERAYRKVGISSTSFASVAELADDELLTAAVAAFEREDAVSTFALLMEAARRLGTGESEPERIQGGATPDARHLLTVFGADGRIRYASPIGLRRSGHEPTAVVGKHPREFMSPSHFREEFLPQLDQALAGRYGRAQGWSSTPGGWRYYRCMVGPLKHGSEVGGAVAFAVDATDRAPGPPPS